jgi:hypothetical protein
MASKFGLRAYGNDVYSRDFQPGRVTIRSTSSVAVMAQVRIPAVFAIRSASSVAVQGRLLWDHIPVAPCEGAWTSIGRNPCAAVTP